MNVLFILMLWGFFGTGFLLGRLWERDEQEWRENVKAIDASLDRMQGQLKEKSP